MAASLSATLGFDSAWSLTTTEAEYALALKVIDALAQAEREGRGALQVNGSVALG